MKLNAPKKNTWWIAFFLAIVAIVTHWFVEISFITPHAFIVLLVGFGLLWLGTFVKGL